MYGSVRGAVSNGRPYRNPVDVIPGMYNPKAEPIPVHTGPEVWWWET
jgi:hypothetical protein